MTLRSLIHRYLGLYFLLAIPLGCSKDAFKEEITEKSNHQGMRLPKISGFTVESKSYHGQEQTRNNLDVRKRNNADLTTESNVPGSISWTYRDGPGVLQPSPSHLMFYQKYKSRMFTISDQSMALNIYPGAILDGRSIEFNFNPKMLQGISNNIRPVTLSTSMPVSGSVVAKTSLPRPIAERALYNAALTDLETLNPEGIGAASLSMELDSFKVYEELKTLYGYNKSIDVFLVGANTVERAGNHYISSKSALKLKFFQENFTIDLDVPNTHNELFDPTGLDMKTITGGVTPVYVKSVTYGRMGIMVIESEYTSDKVYKAVYKQLGILQNLIGIDRHMTEEEKAIINNANIKVKYTGINADADGMIKLNGLSGFIDVLTANKTYSKESPGVPVAFQLAYLNDGHGIVEAPFQINYGPFDKPYVKLKNENSTEIQFPANPVTAHWDYIAYFYTDRGGKYAYRDLPDFIEYIYEEQIIGRWYDNNKFTDYREVVPHTFKIEYGASGRYYIGKFRTYQKFRYGSDATYSEYNYYFKMLTNGHYFLAD